MSVDTATTRSHQMSPPFSESLKPVIKIALIMALRVVGLFMVMPIIAPYASGFAKANGLLIGLATGIYGLSQAGLQMPFGALSDRFGRRTLIAVGLLFFITGSLICATSNTLYAFILGRFCQGAGAIGSVLIAFIADNTPVDHLSKAMAVIGATMGSAFLIAFGVGPTISQHFGVPVVFLLAAGFGVLALLVLATTPSAQIRRRHSITWKDTRRILQDSNLLFTNISIFLQHGILAANFVLLPFLVHRMTAHVSGYFVVLLASAFVIAIPLIRQAENRHQLRPLMLCAIFITSLALSVMALSSSRPWLFSSALWLYFLGFSLLEALLPAMASRFAPTTDRGLALGIYSSSQFFGLFCGGTAGGILWGFGLDEKMFLINALLAVVWLALAQYLPEK